MSTLTDTFPAPTLNSGTWSSILTGSVGLTIGTPTDGAYPTTIDDHGDEVSITSENKITIPGDTSFDVRIFYEDVFTDPQQNIISYLGWRSLQKNMLLQSMYGLDVRLKATPASTYIFQRLAITLANPVFNDLIFDPSAGGDGGFRITRAGTTYNLYRYDTGILNWVLITSVALGFSGPGFIVFGQIAESPSEPIVPWLLQT